MPSYDAIIIGAGQAEPALARRLVAAGRKVAIIERKQFGGTCVNTGCTPTKALAARRLRYTCSTARCRLRRQD
jgi:pyruvate/2-oxoglutarate dehydrogenase complex dihydrolipoamide dehydrogenase (E3) component